MLVARGRTCLARTDRLRGFARTSIVSNGVDVGREDRATPDEDRGNSADDLRGLQFFLEQANRWLPSKTACVLWIDYFESGVQGDGPLLKAMRRGFGEQRALAEAPGHYFGPQPWREQDQLQVTRDHAGALSLLVGIAAVLLITGSGGWLAASASLIGSNFGRETSSPILPAGAGSARRRNCCPHVR